MNKKNAGFSMVEVLIALGAISALGMVFVNLNTMQLKGEHALATNFAINEIYRNVRSNFLSVDACKNTFAGNPNISTLTTLSEIKDRENNVILSKGGSYANGLLSIQDIRIENVSSTPPFAQANLVLEFLKTSRTLNSNAVIYKSLSIKFDINGANQIVDCYSPKRKAMETTFKEICENWKGTYNLATNKCILSNYQSSFVNHAPPIGPNTDMMLSTKHLEDKNTNEMTPRYVNFSGDTMNGDLSITGNMQGNQSVIAGSQICVGTRCRTFNATAPAPSPSTMYARQVLEDGELSGWSIDKNTWGKSCSSSSQLMQGVDGSGNPICGNVSCVASFSGSSISVMSCSGSATPSPTPTPTPAVPTPTPTPAGATGPVACTGYGESSSSKPGTGHIMHFYSSGTGSGLTNCDPTVQGSPISSSKVSEGSDSANALGACPNGSFLISFWGGVPTSYWCGRFTGGTFIQTGEITRTAPLRSPGAPGTSSQFSCPSSHPFIGSLTGNADRHSGSLPYGGVPAGHPVYSNTVTYKCRSFEKQ